jgi:hypothetical protein
VGLLGPIPGLGWSRGRPARPHGGAERRWPREPLLRRDGDQCGAIGGGGSSCGRKGRCRSGGTAEGVSEKGRSVPTAATVHRARARTSRPTWAFIVERAGKGGATTSP